MASGYTQEGRLLALNSPLGTDELLLYSVTGEEGLSRPFHFRLEVLGDPQNAIDPTRLVGNAVSWTIQVGAGRNFHGYVSNLLVGPLRERFRVYQLDVVPWLWFLTRTSDCRVFQNKTPLEIVTLVFQDLKFSAFKNSLVKATLPKLEYCVQYRETDLQFVSRLLEQYGIFYFFEHDKDKHTLVLADDRTAYKDCPDKQVTYTDGRPSGDFLNAWEHRFAFRTGCWTQTDYNFTSPTTDLKSQVSTVMPLSATKDYEFFDYPGGYTVKADGATLTKVRMEAEELEYETIRGAGSYSGFCPGGRFTVERHDANTEKGRSYILTWVRHSALEASYFARGAGGAPYSNEFTAIPATVTFRPPRSTERPVVHGPQTAVVVGPSGEEIYVDEYGRIKVQFFWDREGTKDEKSSCWVRVAQRWAGQGWGSSVHPRVGQEVVVDFLDGDPDRPLVTGSVYNAQQKPPYPPAAKKTQTGIKSRSSKGGSTDNFNEIRFDDTKGSEDFFVQAEKDFHRVVKNDDNLKVGHDQNIEVQNARTETVKEGDETVTVEKGKRTITVKAGNDTHTLDQGNREVKISMGNDVLTISQGNQTVKLSAGAAKTEAAQGIELTVGQSSIQVDPTGVTIKGANITIQGGLQTSLE